MLQKQYSDGVEILSIDKEQLKKMLQEISIKIKTDHPEVNEIILFGSFSKNEFTPWSDLDIAIIVEQTDKSFIKRLDDFLDYFLPFPLDVNLAIYTSKEKSKMLTEGNRFIREILKGINLLI